MTSPSKRQRTDKRMIAEEVPSNKSSPEVEIAALRKQVEACKRHIDAQEPLELQTKNKGLQSKNKELQAKNKELDKQYLLKVLAQRQLIHACDNAMDLVEPGRQKIKGLAKEKKDLVERNEAVATRLERESAALAQANETTDKLRAENAALREQLGVVQDDFAAREGTADGKERTVSD